MKMKQILRTFIQLTLRVKPTILLWLTLSALVSSASTLFILSIPKWLIESLQQQDYNRIIQLILILVMGKLILMQTAKWLEDQLYIANRLISEQYGLAISQKIMAIDYSYLEDPQTMELRERAIFALSGYGALITLFNSAVTSLTQMITLISISILLATFSPWLLIFILLITLANLLINLRGMRAMEKTLEQVIPINRKYNYFFTQCVRPEQQPSFRLYGLNRVMVERLHGFNLENHEWFDRLQRTTGGLRAIQQVVQGIILAGVLVYTSLRTLGTSVGAQISLADFTFYVGISMQFSRAFSALIESGFNLLKTVRILEPFAQFMALPESRGGKGKLIPGKFESLRFENVSFKYPGSDRLILNQLDFEIKRGEHISLVGLNNAGKTTIVKLICRLFEPSSGRILYNGKPLTEYDYAAYMASISAVFQDFKMFPFKLAENINPLPQETSQDDERAKIWQVLREVHLDTKIEALPHGLDSLMDKSLNQDAVEFSGGEKQKLAIARALYKASDLLILDEPTAALDPLAESEIYAHFADLVKGKTALFISHRMSSSLFCDKILLLQEGQIKAFDSHERLMQGHNLYRELFETQASHFRS